jgi:cytochrome c oxidase cbb3-type subunit III
LQTVDQRVRQGQQLTDAMSEHSISKPTERALRTVRRGWIWTLAAGTLALAGAALWAVDLHLHHARTEQRLLAVLPDEAAADPVLTRVAVAQARPLFSRHCAPCHGADLQGNAATGAPKLTGHVWLYGSGRVQDIERTLLYGIRSGQDKTRNVTDMPALGQRGQLTDAEVRDLVQYLLKLNHRPYEAEPAEEGRTLYYGKGDCSNCHGGDARGDSDYGAPDLTANVWNNGGDPQSLYDSLYYGRHRMMPGWLGPLSLGQIRALAVYVYVASHQSDAAGLSGDRGG